ncbi:MAG: Rrf2 family transcriptional regulator [Coprothermobacterota bacterium]|nr:Rrf2 family transcriptional regulator [Coprothermobacterota bacterium]
MRVSARSEYGLRAMVFLASQSSLEPIPLERIGREGRIPRPFLAQIMRGLRRAGLVASVRGYRGGYLLTRSSSRIAVREVVEALEENLSLVSCLMTGQPAAACPASQFDSCLTRVFWQRARQALTEMMEQTTLADLVPHGAPVTAEIIGEIIGT